MSTLPTSTDEPVVEQPTILSRLCEMFEHANPQEVFLLMKALVPDKLPFNPKKPGEKMSIPASYVQIAKLNEGQLQKVVSFWLLLSKETQSGLIAVARSNYVKMLQEQSDAKKRADTTTKHDLVRLLHLRSYPGAQVHWVKALGVRNRQELDAINSHVSEADAAAHDSYNSLAEIFNNREPNSATFENDFQPENLSFRNVTQHDGGANRTPRDSNINQDIVNLLYDLDPNERVRPLRDGAWVKKQFAELRSEISKCYSKFFNSGNQKGDCDCLEGRVEWCFEFADKFTQVVQYAVLIFCTSDMKSLGKEIPVENGGRDTGVLNRCSSTSNNGSDNFNSNALDAASVAAVKSLKSPPKEKSLARRDQRQRKGSATSPFTPPSGSSDVVDLTINDAILEASECASKRENKLNALTFLASSTATKGKRKRVADMAYDQIVSLAGINYVDGNYSSDDELSESEK